MNHFSRAVTLAANSSRRDEHFHPSFVLVWPYVDDAHGRFVELAPVRAALVFTRFLVRANASRNFDEQTLSASLGKALEAVRAPVGREALPLPSVRFKVV